MSAEIELKLAMDPGTAAATVAALFRHPAVTAVRHGRVRTARVVSRYFDTPEWGLAGARIALRLRRDGARWLQTVKGPPLAAAGGALHARGEYEWPIKGPRLDPARLASTPWRRELGEALASGTLAARFITDFERRSLALAFPDGTRATLCADVGAILAAGMVSRGRRQTARVPIAEIEVELVAGDTARLFEFAAALVTALPLTVATANKAMRGQALALHRPDGWDAPARAQSVRLPADAPTGVALAAVAVECIEHVAANAVGLLHDDDPEWIHQMRVGTRRLRSCLGLVAREFPAAALAPLLVEVKWLAGTLGRARDWDVFAVETLPAVAAAAKGNAAAIAGLARIAGRARRRRRAAREHARDAVRSPRFQLLLLAAGRLCALPDFGASMPAAPSKDPAQRGSVADFARRLLRRRHRRLVRQAAVAQSGGPGERHALRIAAKRLRYAAEFFAPALGGDDARDYTRALAALQDVLGRGNDAATAVTLAGEIMTERDECAAAALAEWLGASAAAREPEFASASKRFARTRRFWRRH